MHEILVIYKNEKNQNTNVLINNLIEDTAKLLSTAAGVAIAVKCGTKVPETLSDISSLTIVLNSLFKNSGTICLNEIKKSMKTKEFISFVEQFVEKMDRHRIMIGKSTLIDETIIDYKNFLKKENEKKQRRNNILKFVSGMAIAALGGGIFKMGVDIGKKQS
jgi:hypothetical protein